MIKNNEVHEYATVYPTLDFLKQLVHPSDLDAVIESKRAIREGLKNFEASDYRSQDPITKDGQYKWCF